MKQAVQTPAQGVVGERDTVAQQIKTHGANERTRCTTHLVSLLFCCSLFNGSWRGRHPASGTTRSPDWAQGQGELETVLFCSVSTKGWLLVWSLLWVHTQRLTSSWQDTDMVKGRMASQGMFILIVRLKKQADSVSPTHLLVALSLCCC